MIYFKTRFQLSHICLFRKKMDFQQYPSNAQLISEHLLEFDLEFEDNVRYHHGKWLRPKQKPRIHLFEFFVIIVKISRLFSGLWIEILATKWYKFVICSTWRWIDCFIVLLFKTIAYIILGLSPFIQKRKSLDGRCEITRKEKKWNNKSEKATVCKYNTQAFAQSILRCWMRETFTGTYTENLPLRGVCVRCMFCMLLVHAITWPAPTRHNRLKFK